MAEVDRLLGGGVVPIHVAQIISSGAGCSAIDAVHYAQERLRQLREAGQVPDTQRERPTVESLVAKARVLGRSPLVVEAIWDGDTSGWFLILACVYAAAGGTESRDLAVLSFGNDFRVFQGAVPPWPEAEYAKDVGPKVAKALGVPFHFPSPDEPSDTAPRWADKRA